jgi:hypothetical protein
MAIASNSASLSTFDSAPAVASISQRKRRANRRNARKSTGPRTPEGKARSSRNATTHGLFCRDTVLPGENELLFHALRRDWILKLNPQDSLELSFVDRVLKNEWKLNRLEAAERYLYEMRQQTHTQLLDRRRKGKLDVADEDEDRWQQIDQTIDPMKDEQFIQFCSALGCPAMTLVSLLGDDDNAVDRYRKFRQSLELSTSRALRELRQLQAPARKGQRELPPSPFLNEIIPDDIADALDEEDDEPEIEPTATAQLQNTQNEPTEIETAATSAPVEACDQPATQTPAPDSVAPAVPTLELLQTVLDELHATQNELPEGAD